jgi:hypothetical protein
LTFRFCPAYKRRIATAALGKNSDPYTYTYRLWPTEEIGLFIDVFDSPARPKSRCFEKVQIFCLTEGGSLSYFEQNFL